jgi:hypothetical protein
MLHRELIGQVYRDDQRKPIVATPGTPEPGPVHTGMDNDEFH